jgi:hypothetical protein
MEERKETLKFDEFVFYMLARSFKKKTALNWTEGAFTNVFAGYGG